MHTKFVMAMSDQTKEPTAGDLLKKFEAMADATKLLEQLLANGFIEEGGAVPAAAPAAGPRRPRDR